MVVSIEIKGPFVELTAACHDHDAIKMMHKTGDGIEFESLRCLIFKAEDVACISCKSKEIDVMLTLSNGVTYVLEACDLVAQTLVYQELCGIVLPGRLQK